MKRSPFVCALLVGTVAALVADVAVLAAQQANSPSQSQSGQYAGVSHPPPDDTITTPLPQPPPEAKPAPGKPMNTAPNAAPASGMVAVPDVVTGPDSSDADDADDAPAASRVPSAANVHPAFSTANSASAPNATDGTDAGIVEVEHGPQPRTAWQPVAQPGSQPGTQPALQPGFGQRIAGSDPDDDIVHPAPLPPGVVAAGAMIRVRLLDRLSTAYSQDGERFRARVASDVFRGNQVLIPTGAEIDGTVEQVSTGHFAGHGSMLLHPDTVILPDGSRFRLYAQLTGAPGTNTRVGDEGNIAPGSRAKRDAIEYGGGMGVGVVAGAALGGPAGAVAGTVIGAGAVTVHLLLDHPQATLQTGTVLDFTLTQPLSLVAVATASTSE